ncbi:MAG: hypothetical protein JO090_14450, partial [Rhizobacter sp.]|nr:hypothetical protein [Rhizobacter sp.]
MLSGRVARVARGSRRWRTPLSLGVGVPFLLSSTPAAAAGSTGFVLGGVTTWLGLVAGLSTLLEPSTGDDFASPAAVLAFGALLTFAWAGWRRNGQRGPALVAGSADDHSGASLLTIRPPRPLPAALDGGALLAAARARFLGLQAAWDAGDVQALGRFTTPDMLQELLPILSSRAA